MAGPHVAEREHTPKARGLAASLPELTVAFSFGLDAAEGREPGHASKMAYVAALLADRLGCSAEEREATYYGALLHDVGVPVAATGLTGLHTVDEELVFGFAPLSDLDSAEVPYEHRAAVERVLFEHVKAGSRFLGAGWFPEFTQPAVWHSHENWDGSGFPQGLAGEAIPLPARILRAADMFECVVSGETNPLAARARARSTILTWAGRELQPEVAGAVLELSNDDGFWLGLHDDAAAQRLVDEAPGGAEPSADLLDAFSQAVGDLVDAKAGHDHGRSERVATYVARAIPSLGLTAERAAQLRLAAHWYDIGALGVPARILVKPDLLTLDEMQRMRTHPSFSAEIVGRIASLREAARWVAAHHERVDGKGYPDMLAGPSIPPEAALLSMADAYVAMTSKRPYREALARADSLAVIEAGAGAQWHPDLVKLFLGIAAGADAAETQTWEAAAGG